jgi:hypothetical protein
MVTTPESRRGRQIMWIHSGDMGATSFRRLGNSIGPNGLSIGSSRHVSASK